MWQRNGYMRSLHRRVTRPRFPKISAIRVHKADIGWLNIAWIFRTSWPKMGFLMGKIGERILTPTNPVFLLLGVLTCVSKSVVTLSPENFYPKHETQTRLGALIWPNFVSSKQVISVGLTQEFFRAVRRAEETDAVRWKSCHLRLQRRQTTARISRIILQTPQSGRQRSSTSCTHTHRVSEKNWALR